MRRELSAMRMSIAGLVASTALVASLPAAAAEVSFERLLNAQNESQNRLLPYGSYNNHNHSNLSQINRNNVGDLRVKFMFGIGGADQQIDARNQGSPAVDDGFMYIHNTWGFTYKMDVRSGSGAKIVWVHDAEIEMDASRMRGQVALLGNYVYTHPTQGDMRLLKIDAQSGETVWEATTLADEAEAGRLDQRHSIQPLALDGKLIALTTGTNRRNYIGGFSADDGAELWKFWVIPGPGEFGHESWAGDWDAYKTGGAALWTQAAYDPETDFLIFGTGEPSPWTDPEYRPGDNLFTVTTLAVNATSGALGWYFQEIPDESWDYDNVNPHMLYDVVINGANRKISGNFSRNGYYYTLDREAGDFVHAEAYTKVNWTAGLDPKTGMPVEYNPNALIQSYANNKSMVVGDPMSSQNVCPYFYGMPTLMPPTYDARRQVAYIGAQEGCFSQNRETNAPKESFVGGNVPGGGGGREIVGNTVGAVWAIDARTSGLIAKANLPYAIYSGTLGTAGDLLFMAQEDGKFMALDKDTLSELWSFNMGTPMAAPPITYMVDGKQYVAILAGGQQGIGNIGGKPELNLLPIMPAMVVFGL